ncbi:MAG: UbiA family prenyltransferase [Phycisphaerales bacterium]|nr:UbiA family prenyltransferase [Phycisphaerales bacterium]|tara:strand:- start:5773 stop:6627 length:855 start_codon:yes stop_codon:yes gene_type:complete
MTSRIRAWLDILRISNAPTCVSNVLVGWMIGGGTDTLWPLIFITLVVIAIYLGGMILNDVFDAGWDRLHRPDRPIPSGLIRRGTAGLIGGALILIATASTVFLGPAVLTATCLLSALVLAYDACHRFWPAAVIGMSMCRCMVYLTAALVATNAPSASWLLWSMLAIGLWTAGITLIARRESTGKPMRWPVLLLPLAVLAAMAIQVQNWPLTILTALLLFLQILWIMACLLRRPAGIVPAVLGSIAGFSLLDAFLLGLLDAPIPAMVAVCCFAVVTIIHRPLPGT